MTMRRVRVNHSTMQGFFTISHFLVRAHRCGEDRISRCVMYKIVAYPLGCCTGGLNKCVCDREERKGWKHLHRLNYPTAVSLPPENADILYLKKTLQTVVLYFNSPSSRQSQEVRKISQTPYRILLPPLLLYSWLQAGLLPLRKQELEHSIPAVPSTFGAECRCSRYVVYLETGTLSLSALHCVPPRDTHIQQLRCRT